jgi:hypothetical protein
MIVFAGMVPFSFLPGVVVGESVRGGAPAPSGLPCPSDTGPSPSGDALAIGEDHVALGLAFSSRPSATMLPDAPEGVS